MIENSGYKIQNPEYFHREYENDLPKETSENYYVDQCKRIALVALPFLSLYKPVGFSLSMVMGGLRSITSISQMVSELQSGDLSSSAYALLQTVVAVVALGGTLLAHPLGMLVTTVHDCSIDFFSIGQNLWMGDIQSAFGSSASLVNNSLYLALFTYGGLEIAIASLAMQVFIGLSHSLSEYQKGNYLEAGGHLLMGMIRGNQLAGKLQVLDLKWKLESIGSKRSEERIQETCINCIENQSQKMVVCNSAVGEVLNPENVRADQSSLTDILLKYGNNETGYTVLMEAVNQGDYYAIDVLINSGSDINFGLPGGNCSLVVALLNKDDKMCEYLLSKGASLSEANLNWLVVSRFSHGDELIIERLKFLLEKGVEFKIFQNTLRNYFEQEYPFEILELLIIGGVDVTSEIIDHTIFGQHFKTSMLLYGVKHGDPRLIELLVKYGAPIDVSMNYSILNPLTRAFLDNQSEIAEILLSNGATVSKAFYAGKYSYENALLISAYNNKNPSLVELLLKYGHPNKVYHKDHWSKETTGQTLLNRSIEENDFEMVNALLKGGEDPNFVNPLQAAINKGNRRIIELLLEYGAKINNV